MRTETFPLHHSLHRGFCPRDPNASLLQGESSLEWVHLGLLAQTDSSRGLNFPPCGLCVAFLTWQWISQLRFKVCSRGGGWRERKGPLKIWTKKSQVSNLPFQKGSASPTVLAVPWRGFGIAAVHLFTELESHRQVYSVIHPDIITTSLLLLHIFL